MAPINVIALLSNPHSVKRVLDAAERVASFAEGSIINALTVRLDVQAATLILCDDLPEVLDVKVQDIEDDVRRLEVERSGNIRAQLDDWLTLKPRADVKRIEREGKSEVVFEALADTTGFIVVALPDSSGGLAEYEALLSAVFASGRTAFVTPPKAKVEFGKVIGVAWREDQDTYQLTSDALQMFPNVTHIHLLQGHLGQELKAPKTFDFLNSLNVSCSKHEIQVTEGTSLGQAILNKAHELDVDLLISGAISHSSWHLLWFGNVTKVMLHNSDIMLMMRYLGVQAKSHEISHSLSD